MHSRMMMIRRLHRIRYLTVLDKCVLMPLQKILRIKQMGCGYSLSQQMKTDGKRIPTDSLATTPNAFAILQRVCYTMFSWLVRNLRLWEVWRAPTPPI